MLRASIAVGHVGVAAIAVILLVRVVEQSEDRPSHKAVPPIEHDALPVASLTPGATWNLTVDEFVRPRV